MPDIRKTPGNTATGAVIYDLARARSERAATAAAQAQPSDQAGISESARELARARVAVESAPDLRAERIQALREQIARGEYNPDPREVARKILERGL